MDAVANYFELFAFVIIGAYFFKLLGWFISWKLNAVRKNVVYNHYSTKVTIILPVRNEEQNISDCLISLTSQKYPEGLLEIIVSDDFSDDQTMKLCNDFITSHQEIIHTVRLLQGSEKFGKGKKASIENAIHSASGNLIVTTDADCKMKPDWVNSYVEIYEKFNPRMITGLVKIAPVNNLFSALQAIDILSLSGSSAISVIREKPLMCNGANLAYTKSAFIEAGGFSYGSDFASGDDTFLMLKIAEKFPGSILFNNNPDSIVSTSPMKKFKELFVQRVRWASKVKNYNEGYIKRTGLFIFMVNLSLILLLVASIFHLISGEAVLIAWVFKLIADLLIIYPAAAFTSQRKLLLLILPAAIIYPFYALTGTMLALANKSYQWKGRNY